MTDNTHGTSELNQAVENTDPTKLADNLDKNSRQNPTTGEPESLDDDQQTPFIDDDVRTDK